MKYFNLIYRVVFAVLFLGLALLTPSSLYAQDQITETEVNFQQSFIEAKTQRLLGKDAAAIDKLMELLKKRANEPTVAYELAQIYLEQDDMEKAQRWGKNAVAWGGDNPWYSELLAQIYQKNGRFEEAANLYDGLIKTFPRQRDYYMKKGYLLVRAQEQEKAIKVYDELEKWAGINEETTGRKHSLYLDMGNTKKAEKELLQLVEYFPYDTEYRHMLVGFYTGLGQKSKANTVLEEILRIDPNDPKAKIALAGGSSGESSSDLAYLESLRSAFSDPSVDIDAKIKKLMPVFTKVAQKEDKGLANAALELTEILERVHANSAKGFAASGDLLNLSNQAEAAIRKYETALTKNKNVFTVWEQLLMLQKAQHQYASLRETAENGMDYFPNKGLLYFVHGQASYTLGYLDDALDMFQQAKLIAGRDRNLRAEVLAYLALVQQAKGQSDRATESINEAQSLTPESATVNAAFAALLVQQKGNLQEAADLIDKAGTQSGSDQYWLGYQQALVQYAQKDYAAAAKTLTAVAAAGGAGNPLVQELQGDVAFQQGQSEASVKYWKAALAAGSKWPALQKKVRLGSLE